MGACSSWGRCDASRAHNKTSVCELFCSGSPDKLTGHACIEMRFMVTRGEQYRTVL
jgi:hypothetical protein